MPSRESDFTWRKLSGNVRKITYEHSPPLFVASVRVTSRVWVDGQSNDRAKAIAQCRSRLESAMKVMVIASEDWR